MYVVVVRKRFHNSLSLTTYGFTTYVHYYPAIVIVLPQKCKAALNKRGRLVKGLLKASNANSHRYTLYFVLALSFYF